MVCGNQINRLSLPDLLLHSAPPNPSQRRISYNNNFMAITHLS